LVKSKPLIKSNLRNNGKNYRNENKRIRNPVEFDSTSTFWNLSEKEERSAVKNLKQQKEFTELKLNKENDLIEMVQALETGDILDFSMKSDVPSDVPVLIPSNVPSLTPSDASSTTEPTLSLSGNSTGTSSGSPSGTPSSIPSSISRRIVSTGPTSSSSTLRPTMGPTLGPTLSSSGSSSSSSSSNSSGTSSDTSSFDSTFLETTIESTDFLSFSPTVTFSSIPTKVPSFNPSSAPSLSVFPSSSPTVEDCLITAEERTAQIYKSLDTVGDPTLIRDLDTPQGLAADWLINKDFRKVCPGEKVVQRWIIALFYYATNGDSWLQCSTAGSDLCGSVFPFEFKRRFLSDFSECDWSGIKCNTDNCVTEIEFEENNLIGTIPTEIGLLKDLAVLGMEKGGLTSTIPTEIGGLTNLLFIDLDFNKLSGSFPTQLYSLTDLRTLDLNDNEMTGSIDQLGVFLDLEFLQLQHNEFIGTIPVDMGALSLMTTFNLHGNLFTGVIPESVCNLTVPNGGFLKSLIVDCEVECSCCASCRDRV